MMLQVLKTTKEHPHKPLSQIPEFLANVLVSQIKGKGRGLIANEDFQPGDLILAERALAIVFPEESQHSLLSKIKTFKLLKELVTQVVKNSTEETEKSKKIYALHAGPNLGYLSDQNYQEIDEQRIEGICTVNGFEGDSNSYGLFYNPSFINHECYKSNANWKIYGDFMFIRASKEILKGEEILMSYIGPHQPYFMRRELFIKHDFICSCKLCRIEQAEGKILRRRREILLSDFKDLEDADPEILQEFLEELEELRPEEELNPFLLQPLMELGLAFFERRDFTEAIKSFKRSYQICDSFRQLLPVGVVLLESILRSYMNLGDGQAEEIKKWMGEMKNCIGILYGQENFEGILRFLKPKFVNELERFGYNF